MKPVLHKLEFFPTLYIKLFVFGALTLFAVTGGCIVYWTVTNAFNAGRIVDAQVKVYQAQEKQIGMPTTIIQRYESPMNIK
jgi:hypothetical protein